MISNTFSNIPNSKSSLCPTYVFFWTLFLSSEIWNLSTFRSNGRQTVGDGALTFDNEPSVLAVCHLQGTDDMYYYSTTFSGGPGVSIFGAFDAPKSKCPPDRGSSNWVTASSASYFPYKYTDSPLSTPSSSPSSTRSDCSDSSLSSINHPLQAAASIRSISIRANSDSTPPLTPDNSSILSQSDDGSLSDSVGEKDALDFLMTVFPHNGLSVLPHAKSVSISAPNMGVDFNGIVLHAPGKPKTLYVDGKSAQFVNLRESIVALLDLADEQLECTSLIIVLERSAPNLGSVLHSLMYIGGTVVTMPLYKVDPGFVLVGLEI
ncbi:ornithine decarboxylase antizyme-domain-containing protein [Crepidotus variabilis]|uniref:Ornithine decarboxylase antizyme n=1 Tax=Crepidotus variabilis TaxID=179855 RepID=A0A9P6JT95_9AGAR|nr:ornithine decarboxylase antizyme-domain-containing protein [Crepidotus variabilis]